MTVIEGETHGVVLWPPAMVPAGLKMTEDKFTPRALNADDDLIALMAVC